MVDLFSGCGGVYLAHGLGAIGAVAAGSRLKTKPVIFRFFSPDPSLI